MTNAVGARVKLRRAFVLAMVCSLAFGCATGPAQQFAITRIFLTAEEIAWSAAQEVNNRAVVPSSGAKHL
jgi:hypothetical protein